MTGLSCGPDVGGPLYGAVAANVWKAGCDRSIHPHGRVAAMGRNVREASREKRCLSFYEVTYAACSEV